MLDFVLPVQYLRQIAELIRVFGVNPEVWLARSQLTQDQIAEANFQPSFDVFRQLTEDALILTEEPALGLLLGERLVINTHGVLGFAAQQSESLSQAIQLVKRYLALRTTLFDLEHEHDETTQLEHLRFRATLSMGACERTLLEAVMLAVKNIFDTITLGCARPRQVNFSFPEPAYANLAIDMFG